MRNTKFYKSPIQLILVFLLFIPFYIRSQTQYYIIEIGTGFNPKVMNNNLEVVGNQATTPVLWKNGNLTILQTLNVNGGYTKGINNFGEIIGNLSNSSSSSVMVKWDLAGDLIFVDNAHFESGGLGINDFGDVSGFIRIDNSGVVMIPTVWVNDLPIYLNPPQKEAYNYALDINNNKWAVGYVLDNSSTGYVAFVWKGTGNITILPDLNGNYNNAVAINDQNLIVGFVKDPSVNKPRAAYWENDTLNIIGMPTGVTWSVATDVNSSNEIVGHYQSAVSNIGFIFKDGMRMDLDSLLPTNSGWTILEPLDINDNGAILAYGKKDGAANYCLLIPRQPILIVPGIAGTYASDVSNDIGFILNRGVAPSALQIDPLAKVYNDLITTLQNIGYEQGKDLFVVNYDWRLTPGPIDSNIDGFIDGINAASIADDQYNYGVDYLGWYIKQACDRWRSDYNEELEYINVIVHSTGGLVTRTYIQSAAYGGVYDISNNYKLPKINDFIMIGVPNRGASKAWNPLHDNWIADAAYKYVLSKIINRAYQKILDGSVISGPDYNISLNTILDPSGNPDSIKFINQYVPTIRYLLATYDFIDFGNGLTNLNNDPDQRNTFLLDLNDGYDLNPSSNPNKFLDSTNVTVIYGSGEKTAITVEQRTDFELNAVQHFTDWTSSSVSSGTIWYKDIKLDNSGDETVPTVSSAGQFIGDDRAALISFESGNHTGLVSKPEVQASILNILGVPFEPSQISTGSSLNYSNIWNVISDPVNLFLKDGSGRRLGYSDSTGVLMEIPNSIWFGNADGIGYVFDSVEEPVTLQLVGRGENYYVMVGAEESTKYGGVVLEGFLAQGEVLNYQMIMNLVSVENSDNLSPENFYLAQNYPNPFNPVTTIQFSIPQRSNVTLKVYDVLGKEITTLVNEEKERGVYTVNFDATSLASGIYLYRIQAGSFTETKKMILLR